MATLKVGINRKIKIFFKGFLLFFLKTKLERRAHLFPKREKVRESFLVHLFERKRERETRIIKKGFLIIYSLQYIKG